MLYIFIQRHVKQHQTLGRALGWCSVTSTIRLQWIARSSSMEAVWAIKTTLKMRETVCRDVALRVRTPNNTQKLDIALICNMHKATNSFTNTGGCWWIIFKLSIIISCLLLRLRDPKFDPSLTSFQLCAVFPWWPSPAPDSRPFGPLTPASDCVFPTSRASVRLMATSSTPKQSARSTVALSKTVSCPLLT